MRAWRVCITPKVPKNLCSPLNAGALGAGFARRWLRSTLDVGSLGADSLYAGSLDVG